MGFKQGFLWSVAVPANVFDTQGKAGKIQGGKWETRGQPATRAKQREEQREEKVEIAETVRRGAPASSKGPP